MSSRRRHDEAESLFAAEAAYADSLFRSALGDGRGCIEALRRSLNYLATYAPALLSLGSAEYQLGNLAKGRKLFHALLELPDNTKDLFEMIDKAGDFLIQSGWYPDGLDLYRRATARFPRVAVFHQGIGCCSGHLHLRREAISASRAALALEPDNQRFIDDLGWTLYQAGNIEEARSMLERAVAMDKTDSLAAENLRICLEENKGSSSK